jgi:hypothetical protein
MCGSVSASRHEGEFPSGCLMSALGPHAEGQLTMVNFTEVDVRYLLSWFFSSP